MIVYGVIVCSDAFHSLQYGFSLHFSACGCLWGSLILGIVLLHLTDLDSSGYIDYKRDFIPFTVVSMIHGLQMTHFRLGEVG